MELGLKRESDDIVHSLFQEKIRGTQHIYYTEFLLFLLSIRER